MCSETASKKTDRRHRSRKLQQGDQILAEAVGKEIATKGAVLLCGGLGGVMEAAACGAKQEGGGTTIGILPGTCREDANPPWIDIAITTGMGACQKLSYSPVVGCFNCNFRRIRHPFGNSPRAENGGSR